MVISPEKSSLVAIHDKHFKIAPMNMLQNNKGDNNKFLTKNHVYTNSWCCGILVEDVLHLIMLRNISLVMQRYVALFMLYVFNSEKLSYFANLNHLIDLIKS